MRNINWLVRVKNKTFWIALIPAVLLLGNKLLDVVNAVFMILAILGVVTDPTTAGITDSTQALEYTEPKKDE